MRNVPCRSSNASQVLVTPLERVRHLRTCTACSSTRMRRFRENLVFCPACTIELVCSIQKTGATTSRFTKRRGFTLLNSKNGGYHIKPSVLKNAARVFHFWRHDLFQSNFPGYWHWKHDFYENNIPGHWWHYFFENNFPGQSIFLYSILSVSTILLKVSSQANLLFLWLFIRKLPNQWK